MFAELKDRLIFDPVVDVKTLLAPPENTGLGQGLKVTGNIGLSGPDLLDQGGYGEFLTNESMDQSKAHRLAEKLEAIGHQLKKCI